MHMESCLLVSTIELKDALMGVANLNVLVSLSWVLCMICNLIECMKIRAVEHIIALRMMLLQVMEV